MARPNRQDRCRTAAARAGRRHNSAGFYEVGADFWGIEADIWGAAASHGLRDTCQLDRGFSATHRFKNARGVRFDQLWASAKVNMAGADRHLEVAQPYGSDHALVTADVDLDLPLSK